MKNPGNKVFLYTGLIILLFAILIRWVWSLSTVFWILFVAAITLKVYFLITVFRAKGFKPGIWLYLILAGVVFIFLSILFKTVFHIPLLRDILFYAAICLKLAGLGVMILGRN